MDRTINWTSKSKLIILIGLLLFVFVHPNQAQQSPIFRKNFSKIAMYEVGEQVSFGLKAEKGRKFTGIIEGIEDSIIHFNSYSVLPSEISHIYVDSKISAWYMFRYQCSTLFKTAGAGYFVLDVINNRKIEAPTVMVSAALIGTGLLVKFIIRDKIKIKRRRKLFIINR